MELILVKDRKNLVGSLSDFADGISYSVPMDVGEWLSDPTVCAMTYEPRFSAFHALHTCTMQWSRIAFWWFNLYQILQTTSRTQSLRVLSVASPASLVPGMYDVA